MKKIYTFMIVLTSLVFSSVSGYAWSINNRDLGMSFNISDDWQQTEYSTEFPGFKNTKNSGEKISFEIYYSESHEMDVAANYIFCSDRYSKQRLSSDLSQ